MPSQSNFLRDFCLVTDERTWCDDDEEMNLTRSLSATQQFSTSKWVIGDLQKRGLKRLHDHMFSCHCIIVYETEFLVLLKQTHYFVSVTCRKDTGRGFNYVRSYVSTGWQERESSSRTGGGSYQYPGHLWNSSCWFW